MDAVIDDCLIQIDFFPGIIPPALHFSDRDGIEVEEVWMHGPMMVLHVFLLGLSTIVYECDVTIDSF